ncbi:pantoate--beta-alanine ligase [Lacibacter luteus]|uniref:Pantothenate synthetase n=1 Tax=Lacibacter luteus TaxID=2508719 RepID=A0A4Q1CKN3_9BACT|nr:pantoate--beta-alanine ligase [Lacibacter luteus]RXK61470.1 pantoate--beta-alanine ligase [Lacibacter luteus]
MLIFHTISELQTYLRSARKKGLKTGFVPTMGALHKGHVSLLQQAKSYTDITICSIFVNPTQFNDLNDFKKYPVTINADIEKLLGFGTDILFLPSVAEIYPNGTTDLPHFELGFLETVLEGKYRPGHFQGVYQVMNRLLQIVEADDLFMGQKDYQQCMIIQHLIKQENSNTRLHIAPTLREEDGLAMSSRNIRLSDAQRTTAAYIYKALQQMKQQLHQGDLKNIKEAASGLLTYNGFIVDYTELANASTLEPLDNWNGTDPVVALIAAHLGEVRLIDNMVLTH